MIARGNRDRGLDPIRLQKVLARAGIGSRRRCEDLIRLGRVAVDGQVVRELGVKVRPDAAITVDNRPVGLPEAHVYLLLNKPRGYVSTVRDPQHRPTVLDLVPSAHRIYPVGRLDFDSEGLLLLTNDGWLAQALLHPSHEVEREYQVLTRGAVTRSALDRLRRGIELDGSRTAPATVQIICSEGNGKWLRIVIREGRKRQVRRMCQVVGLEVIRLKRTRIGPIELGNLPPGKVRSLRAKELSELRRLLLRK